MMVRCDHCGGDFDRSFGTHCMANFTLNAQRTELLGRYVMRAESAEARVEALEIAIHQTLQLVTSRDPVVMSPFDALGVYKVALEHLRAVLSNSEEKR